MNKKKLLSGIIAVAVVIAMIAAVFVVNRISSRHKDIIGVTSLPKENTVIMNSPTVAAFVSGEGQITVKDGETIHLEYSVSEGSFDLAFHKDSVGLDVFKEADLGNLTSDGDIFGASSISGSGSLDFMALSGEYTVYFSMHDAVGSATVNAK